jgi:hypothetical protein
MSKRATAPLAGVLVLLSFFVPLSLAHAESIVATELRAPSGEPLCLDVAGSRAENGADLILHRCHGGENQRFYYFRETGELRSALGNFCVDVHEGRATAGNRVQLWTCHGRAAQKFDHDPRTQRFSFRAGRHLCLDVAGNGESARLGACSGRERQRYELMTRHGRARFDELTFLTAHNAFANTQDSNWIVPNQSRGIARALADGVRGFMLDVHSFESGTARCIASFGSDCYGRDVYLCHGNCGGVPGIGYALPRQRLADSLQRIVDFLLANPEEIVTVFLEDYVNRDQLGSVLAGVRGLRDLVFDPYAWDVQKNGWPRAASMVHAGDRLLLISDRADKRALGVAFAQDFTVENYWSMGGLNPDYACRSRWDHLPLDRGEAGFRRLFVMNHFRDVAASVTASNDNRHENLTERLERHCVPAARRKPNFLAVDFYETGDARGVAAEVDDTRAIVFEHGGYAGRAQLLGAGSHALQDLSVGNDRISSVHVLAGSSVVLFEHDRQRGRALTLHGSAAGVGDMNDLTTSLLVLNDAAFPAQHQRFQADFDGDGKLDQLVYHATTGELLLGRATGSGFAFASAGNLAGFGSLLDGRHVTFAGDFTGDGRSDLLFYYAGDGNWWLGRSTGSGFEFGVASNTRGFGDLLGPSHRLLRGDFDGDGRADVGFYYAGNGDIWLGGWSGSSLTWRRAANVAGFGSLLGDQHELHVADFTGDARSDVAFYYAGNGDVWLGRSEGTTLSFARAANVAGFGNLLADDRARFVADFDGDGASDLLFYYAGNGDIWLGRFTGETLSFGRFGNASGFGNLLDASRALFTGDFDGNGRTDLGFHYAGNGDTWLGLSSGGELAFRRASTTTGQGNLLDTGRLLTVGDFTGDGKDDLAAYAGHNGAWRLARSTGSALDWRDAGSSAAQGDLTR